MGFPIFNSKELSNGKVYSLSNPGGRYEYFHAKLGSKIDEVKSFLENNTFVGFMLAKKMAGKGTYAKMLEEILEKKYEALLGKILPWSYDNRRSF